jgi:hypothetical protein
MLVGISREAAAALGRAESAVAASRLKIIIGLKSAGLHPRLHAAIASRFRKCATSKCASEGIRLKNPSLALRANVVDPLSESPIAF